MASWQQIRSTLRMISLGKAVKMIGNGRYSSLGFLSMALIEVYPSLSILSSRNSINRFNLDSSLFFTFPSLSKSKSQSIFSAFDKGDSVVRTGDQVELLLATMLEEFAIKGCPVKCGDNWMEVHIISAILQRSPSSCKKASLHQRIAS